KEGMLSSHWKIYRVVRPELVSKDRDFNLYSINQSEIPEDIEELYAKVDFDKKFTEWDEKNLKKQLKLQQKRFAKYDFPKSVNDNVFKKKEKTFSDHIMERNFDKKK